MASCLKLPILATYEITNFSIFRSCQNWQLLGMSIFVKNASITCLLIIYFLHMRTSSVGLMGRGFGKLNMAPLYLLSATGGMAQEATMFYKCLASLLATKWNDDYGKVMGWLHCCLSFSICNSLCLWCPLLYWTHVYRAPPLLDVICV